MSDTSRIVPGLVYHWGIYAPSGTAHIDFRSVVAARGKQIVAIRTPGAWAGVVTGWEAASPEEALTACQEIVHVTRERLFPLVPPAVYRGPGSLRDASVRNIAELEAKLSAPGIEARAERGSWSVRFWIVGALNVAEYSCEITPETASIRQLQTLEGYVDRTFL